MSTRVDLDEYYKMKAELRRLYEETTKYRWGTPEYEAADSKYKTARKEMACKCNGYYTKVEEISPRTGRMVTKSIKERNGELEYIRPYNEQRTLDEAMAKLEKDLVAEANRKYDFIIERVNAICGTITDASGLRVGAKGDLNGYIKGERGTAKVETIGAGGYNIQCFHFRTLIHEMK